MRLKTIYGKYLFSSGGYQVNLVPGITFMKTYRGYTLVFDWLIYYIEIYTDK